jgi:hypothetical protein
MTDEAAASDDGNDRFELYKIATDEYRFQVTLNWSRTQYYLGLNVAIIGAGTGILKLGGGHPATPLVIGVFIVGAATSALSAVVNVRQHTYYKATRGRMKRIEASLGLPEGFAIATTSGMRQEKRTGFNRLTVTRLTSIIFIILGAIDIVGIIYTATQ